jgi:hypothetical protein
VLAALLLMLSGAAPAAPDPGWPWPPPDPKTWWDDARPALSEAADPLGGRGPARGEAPLAVETPPLLYRLWGLAPLQAQVLRDREMVLEVWVRPARSVRQSVIRVTVRRDGRAFVQGRAGLACCEPGIARRVGFDAELPAGAAARFLALGTDPLWATPRDVGVEEGGGAAEALCVDGTAYDLTLAVPRQARSLRRACDAAAIGQAARVLEAVLAAALGHEPRFDVLYPQGANFGAARRAYEELIAGGGRLKPAPVTRPPAIKPP